MKLFLSLNWHRLQASPTFRENMEKLFRIISKLVHICFKFRGRCGYLVGAISKSEPGIIRNLKEMGPSFSSYKYIFYIFISQLENLQMLTSNLHQSRAIKTALFPIFIPSTITLRAY